MFDYVLKRQIEQQHLQKINDQFDKLERDTWNNAIEAAAKLAETSKGYPTTVSQNILKLKK